MKKILFLLTAFAFCTISLNACGKTDGADENTLEEEKEAATKEGETAEAGNAGAPESEEADPGKESGAQKELYTASIETLDDMLAGNRGRDSGDTVYQETIGTLYIFSEAYDGVLQAGYDEDGMHVFQIAITDGDLEEKHKYECRMLSDSSLWFTFQTDSACEKDLPNYIVNEDVLRYGRVDYVYDDGSTDTEEEKELRRQEAETYLAGKVDGEIQEFWHTGDRLYRIDRKEGIFVDVTAQKESCIADFLREQTRRISCRLSVSEASTEVVEKYKPKGYSLLYGKNSWNSIGVSDLNHDGRMDYVAVLYPDDYEEEAGYEGFGPYDNFPAYYAASFWLLLSSEDGGYEQIRLSDSIEYWDTALTLVEVGFVDEEVLQLEYFVGRSPFKNALLRFQYDQEKKTFYIRSSYYRDAYDDFLMIGNVENYGKMGMSSYFGYGGNRLRYCEGSREGVDDVFMQDGTHLSSYSGSFRYACENLPEEHHINSLIWEREYELLRAFKQHYAASELQPDVVMHTTPVFYNRRLVSGQILLSCGGRNIQMPVMVDKQSGEYVTVTGLLQKEEFMRIFADWSEDALLHGYLTAEEKTRCERAIERDWERADTLENYLEEREEIISFQIVQEGIQMGIKSQEDIRMDYIIIEKEYFWDTKAWDYLQIYEE